jgi:hypothetical protein
MRSYYVKKEDKQYNGQTTIYKTLHRKQRLSNTNNIKKRRWAQVYQKCKQFLLQYYTSRVTVATNPVINHKSTSTPQIGVHWRHYVKSRSELRVFPNRRPFKILWSMADLLLSNRRPFKVCTSSVSLHIISHQYKTSKFPA